MHTIGDGRKVYLSCGTPDNIHVCAAEAMKFISMNRMRPADNDEVDVQEEHNIMLTSDPYEYVEHKGRCTWRSIARDRGRRCLPYRGHFDGVVPAIEKIQSLERMHPYNI